MRNYKGPGQLVQYTNSTGNPIASGDVVEFGSMGYGIANDDIPDGDTDALAFDGIYELARKTADAAWSAGDGLYWDVSASELTTDSTSNKFIGFAERGTGAADTTGRVILHPFGNDPA